jgi:hypothetical protein
LEIEFHNSMLKLYEDAKSECGYNATRFLQMINEHGGLGAARALLAEKKYSEGLTKLWELGRLDLTVEALVLKDEYSSLFTPNERDIARKRLQDLDYFDH